MTSQPVYNDDLSIAGETLLLRRVLTKPDLSIVWDANLNRWRPSSAAFDNHPNGSPMSIVLGDTLKQLGRSNESALRGHEMTHSLAAITAQVARDGGQGVAREPTVDEPAHGVVFGNKSKKVRASMAKQAVWIIPPAIARTT